MRRAGLIALLEEAQKAGNPYHQRSGVDGGRFTSKEGEAATPPAPPAPEKRPLSKGQPVTPEMLDDFEDFVRDDENETMLAIDSAGNLVDVIRDSTPDDGRHSVQFPPEWRSNRRTDKHPMWKGIITHNHPAGTSLSGPDVASFSMLGLKEIRAVGFSPDGKEVTYSLTAESMDEGLTDLALLEDRLKYKIIDEKRQREVMAKVDAVPDGELLEKWKKKVFREAGFADQHKVLIALVEEVNKKHGFGWKYTRTIS